VSVWFTGNRDIRLLNSRYRGKNQATDVLAFYQTDEPDAGTKVLGDVVISVEKAVHQAKMFRHTVQAEIERLLVHGLLHLVGFDHEKAGEAGIMHREEFSMLRKIRKQLNG